MRIGRMSRLFLWVASCLLLLVAPSFSLAQPQALPQKVGVLEVEQLIARAEKEGWNLMVVPSAAHTHEYADPYFEGKINEVIRAGGVEQWLAQLSQEEIIRRSERDWFVRLEQPVTRIGDVVWVGKTDLGFGTLGMQGVRSQAENDLVAAHQQAVTAVGKAVVASLTEEQMDALLHNRIPEDVLDAYNRLPLVSEEWPAEAVRKLEVGGFLPGDRMTDFQRRLLGLAVCIPNNPPYSPEWLATAQFAYVGNVTNAVASYTRRTGPTTGESRRSEGGHALALRVQFGPVITAVSMKYAYSRSGGAWASIDLPREEFQGQALAELVEWAKANLGPEVQEARVDLPPPLFRHATDGPTQDVTALLTPEEAQIYVEVPSDVLYTQRAVAATLQTMGITVTGATARSMLPIPPGAQEEPERYTLYQLLNYMLRDTSPTGYLVRQGNTFRVVEDWELTGRYCLDPIPFLPAAGLDTPITLALKKGTIADFLQAMRDQTGLPLYAGSGAEACQTPITAFVKNVPARDIIQQFNEYVNGAWEKLSDGKLALVPRGYVVRTDGFRWPRPDEIAQHCQKMARMTLALFVEALSPAHLRALQEQGLVFGDLTGPARELAVAAAQLGFAVPNPDQERIALKILGAEPDGSWEIRLWVGSAYKDFTTLAVPTIPPNPVTGWRRAPTPSRPPRRVVDITGVR